MATCIEYSQGLIYSQNRGWYKVPGQNNSSKSHLSFFPIVSDPDILTWINEYSLSPSDCLDTLHQQKQETRINIMCIGHSLNAMSATKVSFLSPCKKVVQGPLRKEVVLEYQIYQKYPPPIKEEKS
jgi:hypothetical protein